MEELDFNLDDFEEYDDLIEMINILENDILDDFEDDYIED